jgi:hypothetical protein
MQMLRITTLAIKYAELDPLASNNISFQSMINKEEAKFVQIQYQNNRVFSNTHFLFVMM